MSLETLTHDATYTLWRHVGTQLIAKIKQQSILKDTQIALGGQGSSSTDL
jgi:hypothetical protein